MTKKIIHKENLSIVQELVDIVNKDNLFKLEYEVSDFKVKVVKQMSTSYSTPQETVVGNTDAKANTQASKSTTNIEQFTNKHPGAVNSPMVGTAYSAPEPGKEPLLS